mgnify:FL=1
MILAPRFVCAAVFWLSAALVYVLGLSGISNASADPDRTLESKALHRRLDLSGLEVHNSKSRSWLPFPGAHGKVLIITLWARSCRPCMQEMPELARLARLWQGRREVEQLLVATEDNTRESVEELFRTRLYRAEAAEPCPGRQHASVGPPNLPHSCELTLPELDQVRCSDDRLTRALGSRTLPITLLIDRGGIVRHAFVGSVAARGGELAEAVERLLTAISAQR